MTKRVRVLKEMPFAKVGEVLFLSDHDELIFEKSGIVMVVYIHTAVLTLVKDGYLEWVEKDNSLEEEFTSDGINVPDGLGGFEHKYIKCDVAAQIADTHYQKKFDEATCKRVCFVGQKELDYLRKSMFGEE